MRRFLSAPLIALALLACATGAYAPVAHAQTAAEEEAAADAATNAAIDSAQAQQAEAAARATVEAGDTKDNAEWAARTISPADQKQVTEPKETKDEAFGYVMTKIMSLFAWLLGVAIITLDYSVYYTVVTMGDFVKDLSAVGITWRILRDIGNIMLIFGFLAIGITTILNVDWYGGGKKMLPMLLVSAVFLNFSLFISSAVIDTGNLFATQFYTQIKAGETPSKGSLSQTTIETEGISNKIMGQLGLQTIYTAGRVNTEVFKAGNTWLIGFMGILLFMTAAFVMFSLAFILIARFVILIFLIILAPIGFAGLAVPKLSSIASKWWSTLFEQTITAPILLLMLYVALAIITDVSFLSGICSSSSGATCSKDWTGFVNNNDLSGFSSMLLSFLVAMGLLLAVTVFAKKLSAFGGGMATKAAGALTFGLTAAGMRSTAGWGSQRLSQLARRSRISRVPVLGRAVTGVLDRGAKANFDVRGSKKIGEGLKTLGIDAGTAHKGGFRDLEEKRIKERETYAKTLELTKGEKAEKATEEGRKAMMERTVKDIEEQSNRETQDLLNKHKVDLKPFSDRVDVERKALEAAKVGGNQQTVATAQLAFNNALLDSQKKREEQNKEREELKKVHDQMIKVQKAEVDARQKRVDEISRKPQEEYATKGLRFGSAEDSFFNKWINPLRNMKAAENILKEAKKSKSDKDLDTIKGLLEKTATNVSAPAPAPAAPAAPHP